MEQLEQIALDTLREHEPPEGYYVCFSGGKDSTVILDLVKRAGVKFEAFHNIMTIEPPELMRFIYRNFPDVHHVHPKHTMHQLIVKHGCPPLRYIRFCCWELKSSNAIGRTKVDGVRAAESPRRAKRQIFEPDGNGGFYLHLIRDWTDEQVWDYIHSRGLPYCELYDQGKRRIGCVFCPFATPAENAENVQRYPGFVKYFVTACDRAIKIRREKGKYTKYATGQEMFDAWLTGGRTKSSNLTGGIFMNSNSTETTVANIDTATVTAELPTPTIEQLTVEVKFYLGQVAQNILEVGKRLIQAKALLPHGEWQDWLNDNFNLSYATAARFIQCAERFGNVATLRDLKYSQMLQLLTLPEDETEEFIEAKAAQGTPVEDMTVKNLRKEIADWKRRDDENQQKIAVYADELSATQILLADTKDAVRTVSDENCGLKRELAAAQQDAQNAKLELQNRPVEVEVPSDYHDVKNALAAKDAEIAKKDAQISSLQKKAQIDSERLDARLAAEDFAKLSHELQLVEKAAAFISSHIYRKDFLIEYNARDSIGYDQTISNLQRLVKVMTDLRDNQK